MNKTELLSTYTAEQLAGMVINLQNASEVKNDEIQKLKWQISSLEEENGRLQSKVDTYNNYLLPKATKEAKELIDHNRFTGVRIVTWEQWNNREESEEKGSVYIPKEYEQTMREILDIDTSKIQDDCHRFSIENSQRYLKTPSPIKISKNGKQNENIPDIQKCQDEYEKLLKESPLEGVMNKITKDILEQKNNAMAMEFTRIICDLLKRYGVYVHCTETKFGEKITANSIEEQYSIAFDSMDFSQHDKEFMDEIEELKQHISDLECDLKTAGEKIQDLASVNMNLQCERNDYKSKAETLEIESRRIDTNKSELERAKNTINQIDDILERLFGVRHDTVDKPDEFEKILSERAKGNVTDFLPTEPIKVADMLINAEGEYEHNAVAKAFCGTDKGTYHIFGVSGLRQIAEHLLVYCNHNKVEEE